MQSFIMNSNEEFIHIHQGCFADTGAIVRLPQCQWSNPVGYGKNQSMYNHNKAQQSKNRVHISWDILYVRWMIDLFGGGLRWNRMARVDTTVIYSCRCMIVFRRVYAMVQLCQDHNRKLCVPIIFRMKSNSNFSDVISFLLWMNLSFWDFVILIGPWL